MREYVKYSLYDRISTRPFLTSIEKKWITFQVLYALHQVHKVIKPLKESNYSK